MTKDEALQLALKALERSVATCLDPYSHEQVKSRPEHFINQSITALRLVIDSQNMASKSTYKEQLETKDEPVAWMNDSTPSGIFARHIEGAKNFGCTIPLYTTPQRTWVGLKDDDEIPWDGVDAKSFARAIEAKLKDKNNG